MRERDVVWEAWSRDPGDADPPHLVKERALILAARQYGHRHFIETGALFGDMIAAIHPYFDHVTSIELDPALARGAARRLSGIQKVRIVEGDSGSELPKLLETLSEPAIFWLDGHYSGGITAQGERDTPIAAELDAILDHRVRNHVIAIDDARCFTGANDYPKLELLLASIRDRRPDLSVEVSHDMIRILPPA